MDIDALVRAGGRIFRTAYPDLGLTFSWRLLTLREYEVFSKLRAGGILTSHRLHEEVFRRVYLGEESMLSENLPFGILVSIGQLALWLSGDCELETLKDDISLARQIRPAGAATEFMLATINLVWKTYSYEDMLSWTRQELIDKFTIAENILAMQNPEFERMKLSNIKSSEELRQESSKSNIDFKADNRAISKAMGPWAEEEASPTVLGREGLAELDRRKRISREFHG